MKEIGVLAKKTTWSGMKLLNTSSRRLILRSSTTLSAGIGGYTVKMPELNYRHEGDIILSFALWHYHKSPSLIMRGEDMIKASCQKPLPQLLQATATLFPRLSTITV